LAAAQEQLRGTVKNAELESERLEQEMIYAAFDPEKLGARDEYPNAAHANLKAYGDHLGTALSQSAVSSLLTAARD
jgi:hypothetical protein